MSPTLIIIIILIIFFTGAFIRSSIGFGDAVLAMPLLAFIINIKTATPLVALTSSTIAILILLKSWRSVSLKDTWRLIISTIVGIPVGLVFLKNAPESIVKIVLGVIIVLFGTYNVFRPKLPELKNNLLTFIFGFIAGIFGGAYNTNGPPIVIYGVLKNWSAENFRATLQGYFLPTGLMIVIGHGISGLWTNVVWHYYLLSLPVIIVAVLIGHKVNERLASEKFKLLVNVFLILIGILLILYSI